MNPDMSVWTGRDDTPTEGPNALRWWQCVKPYTPDAEPGIVLIGFACDEGVRRNGGRVGAKDGPRALRKALANMAWRQGAMQSEQMTLPEKPAYDFGDINCPTEDLESAHDELADAVAKVLCAGHRPFVLGGGHETAWGTFQGVVRANPDSTLGIVNLDSHWDLRTSDPSTSGTPLKQMADWCGKNSKSFHYLCMGVSSAANTQALFDRATELEAEHMLDWDFTSNNPAASLGISGLADALLPPSPTERLGEFIESVDQYYLSIDLDVLPASVMPGVSAPAPRGVPLDVIDSIIRGAAWSGGLIAADIVELNPTYDVDNRSAKTAAYIAWQLSYWWHGPWSKTPEKKQ